MNDKTDYQQALQTTYKIAVEALAETFRLLWTPPRSGVSYRKTNKRHEIDLAAFETIAKVLDFAFKQGTRVEVFRKVGMLAVQQGLLKPTDEHNLSFELAAVERTEGVPVK